MQIADRMRDIPRIGIDVMAEQADRLVGTFRMENADSDISPPQHAIAATRDAVGKDEYNSWLPFTGIKGLREAIAERYKQDEGLSYDPDTEILVTAGTQEAMLCALLATINPGDGVIMADPTYAGMIYRAKLSGGVPQFVPLREEQGWRLDLEEMRRRATSSTRMVFINASNMPTGSIFLRQEIQAIADLARRRDLWVLYNHVADRIVFDGLRNHNIATLPDMRERTILVGGVSKSYNMIGWRIGWVAAPRAVMEDIAKAHMYNATITNGPAQVGAAAALKGPQDYVARCVAVLQQRRDVLAAGLSGIEGVSCVTPTGGWWLLADVRPIEQDAFKFAGFLLKEANVAVTAMSDWSQVCGKGHVRFIFSNEPEDRIRQAVDSIAAAIARLRR